MFREGWGKDKDVIHVTDGTASVNQVLEDVIHHGLEGSRGVAEAEKHDKGFVESLVRSEGCFVFVTLFDANIIEAPAQVKL